MYQTKKYPNKRAGVLAGVIALVVLDGIWIFAFPTVLTMASRGNVLAGIVGTAVVIVIAAACWFFGYSIARKINRLIVLSSLVLLAPIVFNAFMVAMILADR